MTSLRSITDLTPDQAELLDAAGIRSLGVLACENPERLHSRLELIAWQRGRGLRAPELVQIEKWIAFARMTAPAAEATLDMEHIPEAIPDATVEETRQAPIIQAWNPPAMRAAQETSALPHSTPAAPPPARAVDNTWRKVDPSRFATIEEYNEGRIGIQPLSRDSIKSSPEPQGETEEEEEEETPARRVQRIRGSKGEISRWVKRGVVHPRPVHTWMGALVSVLWRLAMVGGIVGFVYFLTQVENQSEYKMEVIAGCAVLLILSMMQLHFVGRSRCRICSCNLYHSKNCLKNSKAHHITGFGYVASASLHLLIFGWFRCMYCGTAIRLKPSPDRK